MLFHRYESYYARFKSIFSFPYSPLPVYYIPGNHDTGYVYPFHRSFLETKTHNRLGISASFSPNATARYTSHFGRLNHQIQIANHTVVFLDAPSLVDEDRQRMQYGYGFNEWTALPGGPVDYVKKFAAGKFDVVEWLQDLQY